MTDGDWGGEGGAGRLVDEGEGGHIDEVATWISDLRTFWDAWKRETPGPHVVLAHSMGGQLAMRALVEKAIDPDAVAMSAPMLGIQTGGLPLGLNHTVAKLMVKLGKGNQAAWKVSEKPLSPMSMRGKMLTHDDDRYEDEVAWWALRPEVKLGPPSWHWVERAIASIRLLERPGALEAVQTPILLLATTADQLVSTTRVIEDSKRLPNVETLILKASDISEAFFY